MKTHLRTLIVAFLAVICAVGNVNAQAGPTISTTIPATAKAYTLVPFAVNVAKNNATAENVALVLRLTGENAAAQATQLELKTSEGAAITFSGAEAVLGTYALAATLSPEFTAKFSAVGNFAYTLELQNEADNTVLASTSSSTAVSYLEPTVNTTLDNVSMGALKIRTNEDVLFSLFGNPNDRTGDMVNVKLTLSDPTQYDNFSLMYNTTGTEFETLEIGADGVLVFGPEEGFLFNEEFEQLLKINFSQVGTYTYTVEIVRVDGNTLAEVTETVTVLEGATVASTLDGTTIVRGRTVDFDVNVDAGSWPNTTEVLARVVLADPTQAEDIDLSYEASAGNYQPLTFNAEGVAYYGDPVAGINLADGTLKLRAVVTENGTYNYTIELVKKIDGQLAAKSEETVTVKFDNATISSDLNNRTGVKTTVAEAFTVTVTAGDVDPATKVLGKFTLADPAQAANIKIEVQDLTGTYMEIPIKTDGTVTIGEDGAISLSQLGKIDFRVTFNNPGTYAYKLELIQVADNVVLASSDESVAVTAFQNATIATTLDARANVKATRAEEFTITATAGDVDPTTMVLGRLTLTTAAQAGDITLEYFDNADNTYKPIAIGTDGVVTIGPAGGMALSQIDDLKFRATFDEAGTYGYKVELVRVSDNVVLATSNESVVVSALLSPTIASTLNERAGVKTGVTQDAGVTTVANDYAGTTVRVKLTLKDPAQRASVALHYLASDNTYQPLPINDNGVAYFGPASGFPLSNATTPIKATFNASGTYEYTLDIVTVGTTETVLASRDESVVVAAFVNATVATTLNNQEVERGTAKTFTVTATANDANPATMVRGRLTLADPTKAANIVLEYLDENNQYQTIAFQNGVAMIGPAEGMPLSNINNLGFRAAFSAAGVYGYTLELINVDGGALVATATESVEAVTPTGIKKGFEKGGFAVYPTLTTGAVKVDLVNARNASIQVIDMMGRAVVAKNNVNGVVELDLSKVAKGTYIVRIQDGSNVNTQRVVVR